jgi:uncharacterized protein (TIGR02118 family)
MSISHPTKVNFRRYICNKHFKKIFITTQIINKMAKMTVIYKTPKDKDFFERHYFKVHIPLAKQLPGLIKYEINDGPIISLTGHSETYRIANIYFDSLEAMMTSFQSEIGQKCAADRKFFAPNNEDVQIYLYDSKNT